MELNEPHIDLRVEWRFCQNTGKVFTDVDKLILKHIRGVTDPSIMKATLAERKRGGSPFDTTVTVIKAMPVAPMGETDQRDGTQNPAHRSASLTFDGGAQTVRWKKDIPGQKLPHLTPHFSSKN